MNWTEEQREAIELKNKNILVAAAAGSGKTAVLVERIRRLIMEDRCSVDNMLIVTFTNAAASEMKEKIRKAISSTANHMAGKNLSAEEQEQFNFLKKQLNLLPSANISTFHAFALEVIRRYFYIIQIEPDFTICDSTQEALLKGEAMDELLEELFEKGDKEFFHFLKCYSGDRDEKRFRTIVENCYNTIMSLPDPFEWLRDSVEQLKDGAGLRNGPAGKYLMEIGREKVARARKAIEADRLLTDGLEADMEAVELLERALASGDYEEFRKAVYGFKLPALRPKMFSGREEIKAKVSANRNAAKKAVKELKEAYFKGDFSQLCHEMDLTYPSGLYLEKVLKRYDELYRSKKDLKRVVDFGDIEHYAYRILKDPEAAEFYRNRFRYIFIDEYQDSNVIQEALIDLIKRKNNLFMVGDVKQSIYKFRLAEPEIFQRKYISYSDGNVPDSVKIDLNRNFRSKKPVIDFINDIFEETMPGYDEKARLYMGDPFGDRSSEKPALYLTQVPWEEESQIDDELKNIMKAEKEAMAAARIIKDNLGTPIFDSKEGRERPLEKRDIVILMRGVKNYGDIFHKVLTDNNLPAYIDDSDGFFNTMEINSFLSALYIIDNPRQDIQLLTLLRSEMMGFSVEELLTIRAACREGAYYDAFVAYGTQGADSGLRRKCSEAMTKIENWRDLSRIMPLDKLIWKILMDTGFYIAMGAMPAGGQRQANLRALTDKALTYRSSSGSSLYGFIRYIEAIKEKKVSMGQVKLVSENDDLVRIMTVHKSKGLEFPMVILAGYMRRLNYTSAGKAPAIHKDLGIGFPMVDPENRWYKTTLLQNMIRERFHREEVDEEKRILYVALTRAKDKLMLLGICNDISEDVEKVMESEPAENSYFAMTGKTICSRPAGMKTVDDEKLLNLSKVQKRSSSEILHVMEQCREKELSPDVLEKMTYHYPFDDDLTARAKYSVSSLNKSGRSSVSDLEEPAFVAGERKIDAAQRGTAFHAVLERIDFARAQAEGESYILSLMNDMILKEMLTEKEKDVLNIKLLLKFVQSPLSRRMAASGEIYREKRFNLLTEKEGKKVLVRGIIDCFFEEEGKLILIDYKTGNMEDAAAGRDDLIRERYRTQLELYREALQNAAGKEVTEMYLYLIDAGRIIKM